MSSPFLLYEIHSRSQLSLSLLSTNAKCVSLARACGTGAGEMICVPSFSQYGVAYRARQTHLRTSTVVKRVVFLPRLLLRLFFPCWPKYIVYVCRCSQTLSDPRKREQLGPVLDQLGDFSREVRKQRCQDRLCCMHRLF